VAQQLPTDSQGYCSRETNLDSCLALLLATLPASLETARARWSPRGLGREISSSGAPKIQSVSKEYSALVQRAQAPAPAPRPVCQSLREWRLVRPHAALPHRRARCEAQGLCLRLCEASLSELHAASCRVVARAMHLDSAAAVARVASTVRRGINAVGIKSNKQTCEAGCMGLQGRSMAEALEQRWEADRVREAERAGQPDTAVRLQPSKARRGSTFGGRVLVSALICCPRTCPYGAACNTGQRRRRARHHLQSCVAQHAMCWAACSF